MSQFIQDKFKLFASLGKVHVTIDGTVKGVSVPDELKIKGLVLTFSDRYADPISVLESGICQMLTFGGEAFAVYIPWNSIMSIRSILGEEFVVMTGFASFIKPGKKLVKKKDPLEVIIGDKHGVPWNELVDKPAGKLQLIKKEDSESSEE